MARRKAPSKSKSSNTSASKKGSTSEQQQKEQPPQSTVKDDPGGTSPVMDVLKRKSAGDSIVPSAAAQIHHHQQAAVQLQSYLQQQIHANSTVISMPPASTAAVAAATPVPQVTKESTTTTNTTTNHNHHNNHNHHHQQNNNSDSGNSSKYLHKKFKRVASTRVEDNHHNHHQQLQNQQQQTQPPPPPLLPPQTQANHAVGTTVSPSMPAAAVAAVTTITSQSFQKFVTSLASSNISQATSIESSQKYHHHHQYQAHQHPPPQPPHQSHVFHSSANELKFNNNNNNNSNNNNNINHFKSSSSRNPVVFPETFTVTHEKLDQRDVYNLQKNIFYHAHQPRPPVVPSNTSFIHQVHQQQQYQHQQQQQQDPPQQQSQQHGIKRSGSPLVTIQDRTAYVVTGVAEREYTDGQATPGKYVCPYCKLACTKPSVLEKHIRAHTNERPFPCTLCGFAFKTKSNLHKHYKSRAHTSRERGEDPQGEDDGSFLGSDSEATDKDTSNSGLDMVRRISPIDERTSSPSSQQSMERPYKPKFHMIAKNDVAKQPIMSPMHSQSAFNLTSTVSASPIMINNNANNNNNNSSSGSNHHGGGHRTSENSHISSLSSSSSSTTSTITTSNSHNHTQPNTAESLEQRIQKLISQNSAIVEGIEAPLQKKYHKICGLSRQLSMESTAAALTTPVVTTSRRSQHRDSIVQSVPPSVMSVSSVIHSSSSSTGNSSSNNVVIVTPRTPQQHVPMPPQIQIQPVLTAPQQPLNLTKSADVAPPVDEPPPTAQQLRNKRHSHTEMPQELVTVLDHPQNPERSIIKDLLLNSKQFGVVDTAEGDGLYVCKSCNLVFQNMEVLKYHMVVHCNNDGHSPHSAPISPAASPHYIRSNSVSMERKLSVTDKKPANTTKHQQQQQQQHQQHSHHRSSKKPDNIMISHGTIVSPIIEAASVDWKLIDAPLPSPGPLLGKTRLVELRPDEIPHRSMERKLSLQTEYEAPEIKRPRYNSVDLQRTPPTSGHLSLPDKLQMFGGQVKILDKNEDRINRYSSGGTMSSITPDEDADTAIVIRTGLHSGGVAVQMDKDKTERHPLTPKLVLTITPTLTITPASQNSIKTSGSRNHFQFPPMNSITAYNPLTLPPPILAQTSGQAASILHGGKFIPYVPGIPGPNTMNAKVENTSKRIIATPKPPVHHDHQFVQPSHSPRTVKVELDDLTKVKKQSTNGIWSPAKFDNKFNFTRMAENVPAPSPRKDDEHVKVFNFENLIAKNEIIVRPVEKRAPEEVKDEIKENIKKPFLRPNSLPLKPGTFTPKQHHGITPNANTLPLISPETPRQSKSCGQIFRNGHAYTYLGLKCSTKPYYCTVSKPQPSYCVTNERLSMYSVWQIYPENKPHPLNLNAQAIMSLYESRSRPKKYTVAKSSTTTECTFTPVTRMTTTIQPSMAPPVPVHKSIELKPLLVDEMMDTQEEVYVRGRGRGKYVCDECGIRCKKPSMLKKHIRTHTDVRPYTCTHCSFSFKTKGNLTKHMKSKAHYKKCIELGIPIEEYTGTDADADGDQYSVSGSERHSVNTAENDDSDNDSDGDGDETDSDVEDTKSRLEHEAARCLLSLSMTPPAPAATKTSSIVLPKEKVADQPQRLSELECRRIITFDAPKEIALHGQYYSDPKTAKAQPAPQEVDIDDAPIDLTKKAVSDIVAPLTGAGLLATLVSNTDRVPGNVNGEYNDEAILPQKYITDRALQDSKIKRSQINRVRYATPPIAEEKKPSTTEEVDGPSMMETLAEVAASSVKLDIVPRTVEEENTGAKNIATEYLKLASMVKPTTTATEESENSSDELNEKAAQGDSRVARTVVVGEVGFKKAPHHPNEIALPFSDGRSQCNVCSKTFQKPAQLQLHKYIHYMERKFRCEPCGVSFRTQGILVKHKNSTAHQNKVNQTSTFGVASQSNPRPFKCKECKTAFRIHGHLAKHLRSKVHILKLECQQRLPFGTYAEIERAGINLTNIDTSDCDSALTSLVEIARKLHEQDPTKLHPVNPDNVTAMDRDSDTEDGDSDGNLDDETLENIQNEPDNGLKRKLSEIENSLGNSPLREEKLNGDYASILPPSPRISPLQSMQRMSPPQMAMETDEPTEKRLIMSPAVAGNAVAAAATAAAATNDT